MTYSHDDYLTALQGHLPRGRVWPRYRHADLTKLLRGLAAAPARADTRAGALLTDAFPGTTQDLLPEWEASLGLPDPCSGPGATLQQRQAQVVARLIDRGGQSVPNFVAFALALGFVVTVTEYTPARVGQLRVGEPLQGEAWAHAWQINAPAVTVTSFRTGLSAVGEPLRAWGNTVLECELRRIAPAHTVLILAFV